MIDILVTGDLVYTGSEIIRNGYVYIKNGKILDFGSGVPPQDYTYATLILGGGDRAILPALIAAGDPLRYAFRLLKRDPGDCKIAGLSAEEQFKLSLPYVYDAHLSGIGVLIVKSPSAELPLSLQEKIGGRYGFVKYEECGVMPGAMPSGLVGAVEELDSGLLLEAPRRGLVQVGDPLEYSAKLASLLGIEPPMIKKNNLAMIVVYNLRVPPLFTLPPEDSVSRLYGEGARVESLIVADEVLVDGGDHLWIVDKHFRDALNIAKMIS